MKKYVFLVCVLLMVLIMTGSVFAQETIDIGAIGPLTGDSSIGGQDEEKGKIMAIEEINEQGGVLGKKVELHSLDDASQPSQSASAAMRLITQHDVVGIVGAHNSPCTMAVLEVIPQFDVPLITPGSSSPKVTTVGNEWVARAFPSDAIQSRGLVSYAIDERGAEKIGLIYVNDDFGKGGHDGIKAELEERGMELHAESFMGEDRDMRPQLTSLKNKGVDALFIWCQYAPGSLIMEQAREMGWDVQFYTGTGCVHPKTFELAGENYDNAIQTVPFIPGIADEEVQDWMERYEERFGKEPSQNSARAYDATMILLDAIERAGTTEGPAVRDALRNTKDFDGMQGSITIDPETGEYIGSVLVVQADYEAKDWEHLDTVDPL